MKPPKFPFLDVSLPQEERLKDLMSRLTLEEKIGLMNEEAAPVPRLGINNYKYWSEALHGVMGGGFTVFPQAIAMASTWDPDLVFQVTTAISDEGRAAINRDKYMFGYPGYHYLDFWSPNVNMARDPRWGRTPEAYGEDPWLSSRIAVAFVKGLQGNDPKYIKAAATCKHFAVNNEERIRLQGGAIVSERALREYYFPVFEACVEEANAQSIMGAYNTLNGVPCNANKWLLTDVLRGEWGFNGYVVTDCGVPMLMYERHFYARTKPEAAAFGVRAGADIECGSERYYTQYLKPALEQGLLTEEDIDRSIANLMRVRFRLGMFDPPEINPYNKISPKVIGSPEHQELARQVSRESIVLLKNEKVKGVPMLPLDTSKIKSIGVVGSNSAVMTYGDYTGEPKNKPVTPLEGIIDRAGAGIKVIQGRWSSLPVELDYVMLDGNNLQPVAGKSIGGFESEFFSNPDLKGTPIATGYENVISFDGSGMPTSLKEGSSARWSGKLLPGIDGIYYFSVEAQGTFKLVVDGREVISYKAPAKKAPAKKQAAPAKDKTKQAGPYIPAEEKVVVLKGAAFLEGGKPVAIRLEYKPAGGAPLARLKWAPVVQRNARERASEYDAVMNSDVVVAVMGYYKEDERESTDRETLDLPDGQEEYIAAVRAVNPNVVVVLIAGSPVSFNRTVASVPAIIDAWYPGEQGGNAIADVLFGDYNPAGRLPFTFYKSVDDLPPFDDYEVSKGRTYMYFKKKPIYPFGYGLSYTKFEYSGLTIDKPEAGREDTVNVSFKVKNVGGRDGDEVVQLYVRDVESSVQQPLKQLKAFKRISLAKGETKTVTLPLPVKKLRFWDPGTRKYTVEPGLFDIMVGASSADIRLTGSLKVK